MPRQPNAYEILGLPRSATTIHIHARYRHLIRRHRPGVPVDQLLADERFRQLSRAYLLLISPERRTYDHDLITSRLHVPLPDLLERLPEQEKLLVAAEAAQARGENTRAIELAKQALQADGRQAKGWALIADVLRGQGKLDEALKMCNFAIQFEPENQRHWQMLNEINALREGRKIAAQRVKESSPSVWTRPTSTWMAIGLAAIFIELSILFLRDHLGNPWWYGVPFNLLLMAFLDAFIAGMVLAGTDMLEDFGDELIWYSVPGAGGTMLPLGLLLIVPGVVLFWATLPFYAAIAWLDEHASVSVTLALGVTAVLTLGFASIYRERLWEAMLLAGNASFVGMLLGWGLGSLRRETRHRVAWGPRL